MLTPTAPCAYTREHFDRELQKLVAETEAAPRFDVQQPGSIEWIAPDLLVLLEEFHDRPVSDLAPLIRRMLIEQGFVDENGDSVIDAEEMSRLDREVELLVCTLERVRQRCNELGRGSGAPAAPEMFG